MMATLDEREMLLAMAADMIVEQIKQNPFYVMLVLMDAGKENEDTLNSKEEMNNMLPEHFEQMAIDGINISIKVMRDIIDKLQETFSKEHVEKVLDMDEIIKEFKDRIQ